LSQDCHIKSVVYNVHKVLYYSFVFVLRAKQQRLDSFDSYSRPTLHFTIFQSQVKSQWNHMYSNRIF